MKQKCFYLTIAIQFVLLSIASTLAKQTEFFYGETTQFTERTLSLQVHLIIGVLSAIVWWGMLKYSKRQNNIGNK